MLSARRNGISEISLTNDGIWPQAKKVECINSTMAPINMRELKMFLGMMVNLHMDLWPWYSHILALLNKLAGITSNKRKMVELG